eukprot:2808005-Pyramimonas_sp.AAC.1
MGPKCAMSALLPPCKQLKLSIIDMGVNLKLGMFVQMCCQGWERLRTQRISRKTPTVVVVAAL